MLPFSHMLLRSRCICLTSIHVCQDWRHRLGRQMLLADIHLTEGNALPVKGVPAAGQRAAGLWLHSKVLRYG